MFKMLRRLFTLKPYGNNLIDGMAELWLVLAALNILSIAICDAVAWAYFGYTTSQGSAAYVSAAAAGIIVFILVGSLDAMFIMHDRTRRRVEDDTVAPPPQGIWSRLRRSVHRDHLAIAARIVLVILTFTVTAPFLTQLFFARDIEANIRRSNEAMIAGKRQEIVTSFDRRIDDTRERLNARQAALENEIAGSGASGRYGNGPTAQAIEQGIASAQSELAALQNAKVADTRSFDAAVSSPPVLASRYGINLLREGPATRARVIAELEQSPAFRATQLTIKAFLVFMFLGLVCLKLFQPESVRIYYSGRLQAAHTRLQAGIFNHRLDPREHPEAGGMNPLRFADWYENDQQLRDVTDQLRDQTALAIERLKAQEDAVRVLQETLRNDMLRMQEDLAATSKTNDDLEQQVVNLQHELDLLNAKVAEEQQELDDFRYDVADNLSLRDQQMLIGSRNRTVRHLADNRAAAARLSTSLKRLTHRLEASRAYENQLRASIASAGNEAASLSKALQKARQQRLADILAAS